MTDHASSARIDADNETRPPHTVAQTGYLMIRDFYTATIARLTEEAIAGMRKCDASGIFSDCAHRTLWDEYCFEVQEGPHDIQVADFLPSVDDAMNMTVAPFVEAAVESLLPESRALLNRWLSPDVDGDDGDDLVEDGSGDTLEARLRALIDERAARRSILHLGPDRIDEITYRQPLDGCIAWDALQELGSETPRELLGEHADELLSDSADLEDFASALAEAAFAEVLDCEDQPGAMIILEALQEDIEKTLREGALAFLNEWRDALSDDAEKS